MKASKIVFQQPVRKTRMWPKIKYLQFLDSWLSRAKRNKWAFMMNQTAGWMGEWAGGNFLADGVMVIKKTMFGRLIVSFHNGAQK
jgi:hypothetical protein